MAATTSAAGKTTDASPRKLRLGLLLAGLCLLSVIAVASAFADQSAEVPTAVLPTSQEIIEAINANNAGSAPPLTDPSAAESITHRDLGREEAVELLRDVFESELKSPAGIFDELEVKKFLAPNVAVIASGDQSDSEIARAGEEPGKAGYEGATLLDSTVPLKTEAPSGKQEAVDLSLEHRDGELQSANPLVEVGIPRQLGEGVSLPGSGVQIELADAPEERAPSTVDDSVAVYPNVAQDTDFAVAPTPTGVETLTQMRSADSPRSQTFNLDLPREATLQAVGGGAEVTRKRGRLLDIPAPIALDATGAKVPVSLEVSGDSLTLTVTPEEQTAYPILIDPLFQTYSWPGSKSGQTGICSSSFEWHAENSCENREEWGSTGYESNPLGHLDFNWQMRGGAEPYVPYAAPGIYMHAEQSLTAGDYVAALYTVPRYFTDQEQHFGEPTSFISHMTLSDLLWQAHGGQLSPYLFAGIWDPINLNWVSQYSQPGMAEHGLNNLSYQYQFANENDEKLKHEANTHAKVAEVSIQATETQPGADATVYVGAATIELSDKDAPQQPVVSAPPEWVHQPTSITFATGDSGLGVSTITASTEQLEANGQPLHSWKASYGCIGVGDAPCPRNWKSSEAGHQKLQVEPALLPTGIDYLNVAAEDPVGNKSTPASAELEVDNIAPSLSLLGTITELPTLGTKRSNYTLIADAVDGLVENPQSGVASVEIKVDGKASNDSGVPYGHWSPGCATQNCSLSREWTLNSAEFSEGTHTVEVSATDAVGLTTTKSLAIELHPAPPPSLTVSGTMTEQGTLGITRPRYELSSDAMAKGESEAPPSAAPSILASFGSEGAEDGQLSYPEEIATDHEGDVWVADAGNDRIEEFGPEGEYLRQVGSEGSGPGQFREPSGIATDAKGDVWVADTDNSRIEEFGPEGEYLRQIGSEGSGPGQLSYPYGIATDAKGDVWVADTDNSRIEEITEAGTFVRQVGSEGPGPGQLSYPYGIAVDAKGDLWVADTFNNRVQELDEKGEFLTEIDPEGPAAGNFALGLPRGIALDSKGDLWLASNFYGSVQEWRIGDYEGPTSAPIYWGSVGSEGTGNGQFHLPSAVAMDPEADLWVADSSNGRIEELNQRGRYLGQFGAPGSGNGQLEKPNGIAIDSRGDFWVLDAGNARVEEFGKNGEYLSKFGSSGTGSGQFLFPSAIALDAKGNIWVADSHHRVQEFSENGELIRAIESYGSGPGQLEEPNGIAIDAQGHVWVSDGQDRRVEEFNARGEFLSQFAVEERWGGSQSKPYSLAIDSRGYIWVEDADSSQIEAFNRAGQYLTGFGSWGSGNGQFGSYVGLTTDSEGHLWVADAGHNRVQRWAQEGYASSEIATEEISVDGKQVDTGEAGCATETCSSSLQWTLESSAYPPGKHTVEVKATDGYGSTTTKTLNVEIQRDTTKPTLEVSGELIEAPEGWVQQESYGLHATAKDPAGYGVTSLAFEIDGKTIASTSQECPAGGCEAMLSKSLDMSAYSGGAHEAELTATDGAGNATTKRWTINVDPEGHITATEARQTLEALEGTSESTIVASTSEAVGAEERASGNNPILIKGENGLESKGVPDPSTISPDPGGGFTVELPDGSISAGPVEINKDATPIIISKEAVAIGGSSTSNVDSVTRPIYDGIMTFESIRSASASATFSWKVDLNSNQVLRLVDSQNAEVDYKSGHEAYLVTAEPASDAVGTNVPTSLSVSDGNIITLTVAHKEGSYVYPVVAGAGWQGGYWTETVVGPKNEIEIKEEEERIAREREEGLGREWAEAEENRPDLHGRYLVKTTEVDAPEADSEMPEGATISSYPWQKLKRGFKAYVCEWWDAFLGCLPRLIEEFPKEIRWAVVEHGTYHYTKERYVWFDGGREGQISCSTLYERHEEISHSPLYLVFNKGCYFNGRQKDVESIVGRGMWRVDEYSWFEREMCIDEYVLLFSSGWYSATPGDPHEWNVDGRTASCNFAPQDTQW